MDIKTAKEKKIELEKTIGQALQDFEEATETTIAGVYLKRLDNDLIIEISARL